MESVDTKLAWEGDRMLRTEEGRNEIATTLDKIICRTIPGGLAFDYLDFDVDSQGICDPTKRLVPKFGWEPGTALAVPLHPTSVVPKAIVFAARREVECRPPHLLRPDVFRHLQENTLYTYRLENGIEMCGADYLELQDERFVVLAYNMHECRETCWKKDPRARNCRFGFPHQLCANPTIEVTPSRSGESLKVQVDLTRNHSQVNSYIPLLARALRCNTDAMYAGVVYGQLVYMLSYSTKSDVPDMKILSDRLLRALKRMAADQYEKATYGDLMLTVANSVMGSREISAPEALMFILGERMKYVSKKIVRLDTSQPPLRKRFLYRQSNPDNDSLPAVAYDDDDDDNDEGDDVGRLRSAASGLIFEESKMTRRQYKNYSLRPLDVEFEIEVLGGDDYGKSKAKQAIVLRDCSFVTFVAHFEEETSGFDPNVHPSLRNWRIRLLPDEQGRRLYMRQRTSPAVVMFIPVFAISDHNDQSAYSLLVAHIPWQSETELVEGYDSPIAALQAKMHLFPDTVRKHFEHRRQFETVLAETVGFASNLGTQNSTNHSYFHGEDEERLQNDHDDTAAFDAIDFTDFISTLDPHNDYFAENPHQQDPHQTSTDGSNITAHMSSVKVLTNNRTKRLVHQFTSDLNKHFVQQRNDDRRSRQSRDRLQSSSDAYGDDAFDWQRASETARPLRLTYRNRAVISEDKTTLSRSKKQTAAYLFIEHQLKQNSLTTIENERSQINLLILGGAGSGKSVLLNAITRLFRIYFKPGPTTRATGAGTVLVLAPTGIAAVNVKGETIDTYTSGYYRRGLFAKHKVADEQLSDVMAIVLDEISLISPVNFHALDMMLRMAKKQPDAPFGGVHVVIGGDFR